MSDKPPFHRFVFGLASFSVFFTGIFYLSIGLIYAYFSFRVFDGFIIGEFGDIFLAAITMIGGTFTLIFLGIFHGKIGVMFFEEEGKIWKAYSKLIYLDAAIIFVFVLLFVIGAFDSAKSSLENRTVDDVDFVISVFFMASIPISIAILHIFIAWGLSNENFFAAIALFIRNALRMTMILMNAAFILALVLQFDISVNYLVIIFSIWIAIDGVVHIIAAGILINSAYIENHQSRFEDDDFDEYNDSMYDYSVNSTQNPLERYSKEKEPDTEWQGEFREDGYEWIEFPQESDAWFWRNEDGNWIQYE